LYWASLHGHVDVIDYLVNKGASVDIGRFTPLFGACEGGKLSAVKYLVEKMRMDVNHLCDELPPLYFVNRRKYFDIVKVLLRNGADVNRGKWPVGNNDSQINAFLVEEGITAAAVDP
jgi:ankyrin repeat protein